MLAEDYRRTLLQRLRIASPVAGLLDVFTMHYSHRLVGLLVVDRKVLSVMLCNIYGRPADRSYWSKKLEVGELYCIYSRQKGAGHHQSQYLEILFSTVF
jgi:hypothetical protein